MHYIFSSKSGITNTPTVRHREASLTKVTVDLYCGTTHCAEDGSMCKIQENGLENKEILDITVPSARLCHTRDL